MRVAILSAMETVNPKVPSTVEAAALCKMADRGQITGALLDGPLALDNAISLEAAKIKKIDSPVAGRANVLVVPDLEAGNMLAKSLSFLAGADAAGIVLGARVPIILTSRADSLMTRLASCAVAALVAQRAREAAPRPWVTHGDAILAERRHDRPPSPHRTQARRASTASSVLNAGSSSIKFSLFGAPTGSSCRERAGRRPVHGAALRREGRSGRASSRSKSWDEGTALGHDGALEHLIGFLRSGIARAITLVAVGHRVVHGGLNYAHRCASTRRCSTTLEKLRSAGAAAPAAQPRADPRRCSSASPQLPQVACFDTAFHRAQPQVAQAFALPQAITERGVRRYGFHGLSYEYIAQRAAGIRREAPRRAGSSSRTSATALGCARSRRAGASRARWVSPRSMGCRWARAAARSIPASCST